MSPTGNQRKGDTQLIFVGHDWLEDDHDVAVMNEAAGLIRSARLSEGLAGVAVLHALVSGLIDDPAEVVICTETDRGLFVGANGEVQRHARNLNPEPEEHGHPWA
jgi:hypothetical protein